MRDEGPLVRELLLPRGKHLERNMHHLCLRVVETIQWEYQRWGWHEILDGLEGWTLKARENCFCWKCLKVFEHERPHSLLSFIIYLLLEEGRSERGESGINSQVGERQFPHSIHYQDTQSVHRSDGVYKRTMTTLITWASQHYWSKLMSLGLSSEPRDLEEWLKRFPLVPQIYL